MRSVWRERLNPQQRAAVEHRGEPLLILAGAGTGKTLTLACRVAHLLEGGAAPERILLITFTRRAAQEMLTRADLIATTSARSRAWGGTFHAVANRLLRLHGRAVGLRPDFTVIDRADSADVMNLIRAELGLGDRGRRFPGKDTLVAVYSRVVNTGHGLRHVLQDAFPWCAEEVDGIRDVFVGYRERKARAYLLDFDDLLLSWRALVTDPHGDRVSGMFDHVLVDEFQDTNALQADIVGGMARRCPSITVVGDDAQSIYSFRSATVRNILEFPARFPGTRVVRLEQNYRSTSALLRASNAVISLSPLRHEKTLWSAIPGGTSPVLLTCRDEPEQSEAVCRHVLEHREQGVALRSQAVLFRAAHHSTHLELELARRNIPFVKYGGLKFLEAAHVKDLLAVLRIMENPRDEVAWHRLLQLLDGVGPAGARRMLAELRMDGEDGETPLDRFLGGAPRRPGPAGQDLASLRDVVRDCLAGDPPVTVQVERVARFLGPVIVRRYASAASRQRDLEHLQAMAAPSGSRARFLADLVLDPPTSTGDLSGPPLLDEDYLVLSTIHSAKGLEWEVVHVIHAADGMIPSDLATGDAEQVEEERRLLYVAMTRARRMLYVSFPLRYHHRPAGVSDGHGYAQLTRFLPPEVRSLFEERLPSPAKNGSSLASPPATSGSGREAVEELLAALWRG